MENEKKDFSETNLRGILCQQLELLAKTSLECSSAELPGLTDAMCKLFEVSRYI